MSTLPPLWRISDQHIPYEEAVLYMEQRIAEIKNGGREEIWLLEHPPLITSGTSARKEDLLDNPFPLYEAGRGGQYTYHGPGQRVIYVMLDLNKRGRDLRAFVKQLETWVINTLNSFNIRGEMREGRIGVWVKRLNKGVEHEDKIAAIGLRVRHWVTWHGISLNIEPNLSHFDAINPCGIKDERFGVTSFHDLGHLLTMEEVDSVLKAEFEKLFNIG